MADPRGAGWTEQRMAMLVEMQERGPKVIWAALNELPGPKLTKSAVIGKRDRLRGMVRRPKKTLEEISANLLARRERNNAAQRKKRQEQRAPVDFDRRRAARNRVDPVPYVCQPVPVDLIPLNIPFSELERGDCKCRWAFDAPAEVEGSFVFCGHQTLDGDSYCFTHRLIASPPQPKKAIQSGERETAEVAA